MNAWTQAGALCDVAIEGIRQCKGLSGPARDMAWSAPAKAIDALEALIAEGLDDPSRARWADLEFAAVEKASRVHPGWREWPMSSTAWALSTQLLTTPEAITLGFGRFASLAKGLVHKGHFNVETLRLDVGGKLLKILREAPLCRTSKGFHTPASQALSERMLRLHGDWCQRIGLVADSDWEAGTHAYGFGTWFEEFKSGSHGGPCSLWRDQLLRACSDGLERFGRLPMKPMGHIPNEPPWMILEHHAGHSAGNGEFRPQWQWSIQFPLAGASDWDRQALAKAGWANPDLLDDPIRGRGAALFAMIQEDYGPGRELSEFTHGQAPWIALLEARMLRAGLPDAETAPAPKRRAHSL